MATLLEYAQFSTAVYAASDNNALGAPPGWTMTRWQPDTASGFSAGTFVSQGGADVVIAYTGTNDKMDMVSWSAGAGAPAPQIAEAMRYYFSVRKAYPNANITFTGHSLGAGLAAMMAVYFDKPATVFDAAPFLAAAASPLVTMHAAQVAAAAALLGAPVEPSFVEYVLSAGAAALWRQSKVANYAVEGEVLSYARSVVPALGGPAQTYGMGESDATMNERHSMALLTAFEAVPDFNDTAKRVSYLVTELMDQSLFAASNKSPGKDDILRKLLRHQLGVQGVISPDRMLQRFTDDIDMAIQPGGLTATNDDLGKAMVAFAMQMYDRSGTAGGKTLFEKVSGGIRFDRNDIAASLDQVKGYNKYFTKFLETLGGDESGEITKELPNLPDWFIQAGSSALNATADGRGAFMLGGEADDQLTGGGEKDVLAGGEGDDTLDGMAGDDVLLGGDGDDKLTGGEGSDTLFGGDGDDDVDSGAGNDEIKGGDGHDTYRYRQGDGYDTITDADGDGEILFGGTRLNGGKRKKNETIYKSRDKKHSYEWDGGDLTIDDTIVVAGFNNGDLGIYLDEEDDPDAPEYDPPPCDPLVLDLDGNGRIDTLARSESSAYFDFNNDGIAERSGWIAPQDGFLVLDANGNGAIDNLSEMFGNAETNGFADLKQRIDSNGDNSIDAGDEQFSALRIWQDANSDGIAQQNEVFTLTDLGITSIGLVTSAADIRNPDSTITATGTYIRNGETRLSADVQVEVDFRLTDSNPFRALDQELTLDADIYDLPWLRGFGLVRTLPGAYQVDLGLRQAAAELAGGSAPEILAGFDAFFQKWSGLEAAHKRAGVSKTTLGIEDKLWVLETLLGQDENKRVIEAAGFANAGLALNSSYIESKYLELTSRAALGFAMQAAGRHLLDGAYYSVESDKFIAPDPARVQASLQESLKTITAEDDALFAAMVVARLAADEVKLDTGALKQALSESPFAQLLGAALDFSGQHVAIATGSRSLAATDGKGWFLVRTDENGGLHGAGGNDVVIGSAGGDYLSGGAGRDTLAGREGNDSLYGGSGNDLYLFETGAGEDWITEQSGTDTIRFGSGIAAKDVSVSREGANLRLRVGNSGDGVVVSDWFSHDSYKLEWIEFADGTVWGVPQLLAFAYNPTAGADELSGGVGNDVLAGLAGDDWIVGEAGADSLDGGAGDDFLLGGSGNDVYLFARGYGNDTVVDVDATAGNIDTVRFAAGIVAADVIVTRDQYSLYLRLAASDDRLKLENWFSGTSYRIERVEFADGTVWGVPELLAGASLPIDYAGYHVGGSGSDTLVGLGGDDTLEGGAGDDTLDGGGGNDTLSGGSGNDVYLFQRGDGSDTISEYGGTTDTIRFGADIAASEVRITRRGYDLLLGIDGTEDQLKIRCWFEYAADQVERVEFSDGTVWGLPELWAAALTPSAGADYLMGGSNSDVLSGQDGDDTLDGGAGNDALDGGAGNDALDGGAGNDTLGGGAGEDVLDGGAGDDTLGGGAGEDVLFGGEGSDVYLFERGDGADTIWDAGWGATSGTDTIRFGAGIAAGDIRVRRERGNINITLAGSEDRLALQYWSEGGYQIERFEFADGTMWGGQDLIAASMLPTEENDALFGTAAGDVMGGLGGDDVLSGGLGDDVLSGDAGDDSLEGEDGADTLSGGAGEDYLSGGGGNDVYRFGRGDGNDDVYDYKGGDDAVVFGAGISAADVRVTRTATDLYLTLAGSGDRLALQYWFWDNYRIERIAFADGSAWDVQDLLEMASTPTAGEDILIGADGDDLLAGLGGNDRLEGGAGNDTLEGGSGDDLLLGGSGSDVYLYSRGDGADTIADGSSGVDVIRFGAGIAAADVKITRDASWLYLSLAGSADRLALNHWSAGGYTVERVEFADGTILDAQDLVAAVSTPTAGDDYLQGTSADDVLAGGAGNDTLYDSAGNNVIDGGDGDDTVYSCAWGGADGALTASFIRLGKGDDTLELVGERNVVVFNAGDGEDRLTRLASAMTLSLGGGISAASLTLTADGEELVLGMGNGDSIRLSELATAQLEHAKLTLQVVGPTIVTYDLGAVMAAFKDGLAQDGSAPSLASLLSSHWLGSSEDLVIGGELAYRYARDGTLSALAPEAMRAALASTQFGRVAQQISIDRNEITGTESGEALAGSTGRDTLWGKGGDDTLDGGDGNDTYRFGAGDGQDLIVDAGGIDTIEFGPGIAPESLSLSHESGALLIRVGGVGGVIRIAGFDPGNVDANPVIEQFRFANGRVLSYEQLLARGFEVRGDGVLNGTAMHDLVIGNGGDDTITGGTGDDILSGDLGNDRYLFNLGDGVDTVYDLATQAESNRIVFGAGITRGDLRVERREGAIMLRYSASDAIVFPQFDLADPVSGMAGARIELADGAVLMFSELSSEEVAAVADDGGPVAAGGTLALSAQTLLANDTTSGPSKRILGVSGRSKEGAEVTFVDGQVLYKTGDAFQGLAQGATRTDTFTYTVAAAADASVIGTATATATVTVTVTVTGVNDAPVVAQGVDHLEVLQGRLLSIAVPGTIFSDADEDDALSYAVTTADGGALPGWLHFDAATGTLQGRPGSGDIGVLDIRIVATDRAGAAASDTFAITVVDVNDAPVYANPIAARSAVEGDLFSYTLAADAFVDADAGDVLSFSVTLATGDPLPAWLKFNAATRTFSGTPDVNAVGRLDVRIVAADQRGYEAAGNFELVVQVSPDRIVTGTGANDSLAGASGNDRIDGGAGKDTMAGKRGNDTYIVDHVYDTVVEYADEGIDLVRSSASFTLGTNVEQLVLTGTGAINGYGNSLSNVLTGNDANNILDGRAGADTMAGGLGNDTYVVDHAGDVVAELSDAGTDLVQSSVSFTLGAGLDNLTLTGSDSISGTGNELINILTGNSAANALAGGAGNDTYIVDHVADTVREHHAEGIDLVQSSVSFTLGDNVEHLTLTGSLAIDGTGNELDNTLTGNGGANVLAGGAGNDTLSGGAGADQLLGGAGDDVYVVDNAGDLVTEQLHEGSDLVKSSVSITLGANLEQLILTGTGAIAGTGNAGDNVLAGNAGSNTLSGEAGNDTLDGGAGADKMLGGEGDDTYAVDHASDTVTENAGQGVDLVLSSVSHTLANNVEQLRLTGVAAINATGNTLDNVLTGNAGANTLNGGLGNDLLAGGAGNDVYVIDAAGDVVVENPDEGIDLVQSGISCTLGANLEDLTLTGSLAINGTGNERANLLTGNAAVNILFGDAGNDTLNGGAGADQLQGGTGDDVYVVDNAADVVIELAGEGADLVQSSVTHVLAANLEHLTLTGSAAINGTGNAANNLLKGNGANNTISGGGGNDVLQGGAGADTLTDTGDNNLLDGGAGNDTLVAGRGNDFLVGGAGNDTITAGSGSDVLAFNRGDGQDLVLASTGGGDTLSLGRGIGYADLLFSRSVNNLVLTAGSTDQITFKDWYASVENRSIAHLQMVIEGTAEYSPGSGNALKDQKIEQFDFAGLVDEFDRARAVNPALANWALSGSLLEFHLGGSDTAAFGGDIAYGYAKSGSLSSLSLSQTQEILAGISGGGAAQTLDTSGRAGDLSPRLM